MHRAKLNGFAVLVLLSLLLAVGGAVNAGGASSAVVGKNLVYYALGDSVASGYGLAGDPGVDCRQAPGAYPLLVASFLAGVESQYAAVGFVQLACSGASTDDLAGQVNELRRDLSERRRQTPTEALVSITVGVNDFNLTDPFNLAKQLCNPPGELNTFVENTLAVIEANLDKEMKRILQPGDVYIVLTDYHNPFNRQSHLLAIVSSLQDCQQQQLSIEALLARTEFAVHALNATLPTVADSFGA